MTMTRMAGSAAASWTADLRASRSSPLIALSFSGRLSVRRTPHGVASRIRMGWTLTSGRRLRSLGRHDQGIDDCYTRRRGDHRVQVDLDDVRPVDDELAETDDQLD